MTKKQLIELLTPYPDNIEIGVMEDGVYRELEVYVLETKEGKICRSYWEHEKDSMERLILDPAYYLS